jgi:hypothetical protein
VVVNLALRLGVFAALCLLVLGLTACGGDDAEEASTATATTEAEAPASATATSTPVATPTLKALTETEVIRFEPPAATESEHGSCFGPSFAVARFGAWRCMTAGSEIHDPCFGDARSLTVTCVADPITGDGVLEIDLLDPACVHPMFNEVYCAPDAVPSPPQLKAWAVVTEDGRACHFQGGTTGAANGVRMNYLCSDGSALLDEPMAGTIWTARQVACMCFIAGEATPVPETRVRLRTVWY